MRPIELKVARIGNSRGVRLPAASLKRYGIGAAVVMEERSEGILLRPTLPAVEKLSWAETAREMAAADEDWGEWDAVSAEGLADLAWEPGSPRREVRSKPRRGSKAPAAKRS